MERKAASALALLVLIMVLSLPAWGEEQSDNPSLSGEVDAGGRIFIDGVSGEGRGKFEEYRDIPSGPFLEDLHLVYDRPAAGYRLELNARDVGEEDQHFQLRSGEVGRYSFEFDWDQMPHRFSSTARSPYVETSHGVLELPDLLQSNLETASAANKPGILESYLSKSGGVDLKTRWDTTHFRIQQRVAPGLELGAEYGLIRKTGTRALGTTFSFTNPVELPEPIDELIQDLRVSADLVRKQWQVRFDYDLSIFQNRIDTLVWDNPLAATDQVGSPSRGRLDLPPDNVAHTFSLSGAGNLPGRSRVSGTVSYSWRMQNDPFLPHTLNSAISSPGLALPAESLDGDVRILMANLRFYSRPIRSVTTSASYRLYSFNNKSPELTFPEQVRTDVSILADPATSSSYNYVKQNAGTEVGWRPLSPLLLRLGFDWERWSRNSKDREAPRTNEETPKITVDYTVVDWALLRLSYSRSWRRVGNYNTFAHLAHLVQDEVGPDSSAAQDLLLRKYDEADRDRNRVDFLAQISAVEDLVVTPTVSFRDDDFKNSTLGLQDDRNWAAGLDLSWNPWERLAVFASYMHEEYDTTQRSRYRTPPTQLDNPTYDWVSNNNDSVDTVGTTLSMDLIPKRLDLNLVMNLSRGVSKMRAFNPVPPSGGTASQNTSATAADYPDIKEMLQRLETSFLYHVNPRWVFKVSYVFERFIISDFRVEDIQPYMGNVDPSSTTAIYLGAQVRDYTVHILSFITSLKF